MHNERVAERGMDPRERVRAVLRGDRPDTVPFNFWMDRPAMARYDRELSGGRDFRLHHFGADVIESIVPIRFFSQLERKVRTQGASDWQYSSSVKQIEELLDYRMPEPDLREYTTELTRLREEYPDRAIFAMVISHLDVLLGIRRMEEFFLDLYDAPEAVRSLCERISDTNARLIEHVANTCDVDAIYLAGDICGNSGPLLSRQFLREYWSPGISLCTQAAHRHGLPVLYHTDGRVIEILDLMAETGIDGINPLQANLQSVAEFSPWKQRFIVYGAMDNNFIIPAGPPERIENHISGIFSELRDGRGLILSSHDIQEDTPFEHIEAMVGAIRRCRYT